MNTTPLAIIGATASGKTALALALAQNIPIEIISMDSALIYRGMNIGTAKPTPTELATVPHHLIDILEPVQSYSVSEFVESCRQLVMQIQQRGRLPVIVGGTMMYYNALVHGLSALPEANPAVREQIQAYRQEHGIEGLYQWLSGVDEVMASRLERQDSQRIERALEVFLTTGQAMSELQNRPKSDGMNIKTIGLLPEPRHLLHENIAKRFHKMIEHGLIDEVITLRQNYPDLHLDLPSMRCVGYRQAWQYLEGEYTKTEFIEKGISATRQLAKRQITWLKRFNVAYLCNPYSDVDYIQQSIDIANQVLSSHLS